MAMGCWLSRRRNRLGDHSLAAVTVRADDLPEMSEPNLARAQAGSGWPLDREPLHLETSQPGIFVGR
jgi:hypothetical protein